MSCTIRNSLLLLPIAILVLPGETTAQIVSDDTLPNNSSVQTQGDRTLINGGTPRGSNLFHSFEEFSVPTGAAAWFNNDAAVENIITRVTGSTLSNIDGLIGANGSANLFLLNPNGIIFGPNAQLDIGGSFVGSTAESILFKNQGLFSATAPNTSLLTINVPVGLQMGQGSEAVQVQGRDSQGAFALDASPQGGLAVAPGRTLALVGDSILFNGGIATVPSGRLELGGVEQGNVELLSTRGGWRLKYPEEGLGDIQLSDRSLLANPNFSPNPNGGIYLTGANIALDNSQIGAVTLGTSAGADITLTASESVSLQGADETVFPFSSVVTNIVNEGAGGSSGQIRLAAPNLSLQDGGRIFTLSFGAGAAGKVVVEADSINLNGFTPFSENSFQLGISPNSRITSANFSTGAAGDVDVSADRLTLLNGGQIATQVGPAATGQGGNVNVNVQDTITAVGVNVSNPTLPYSSLIGSQGLGAGEAGAVNVKTKHLTIRDGANIGSIVSGTGKGRDVRVEASESILIREIDSFTPGAPSQIGTITLGPADSGNVSVSTERLTIQGATATEGTSISSLTAVSLFPIDGSPPPGAGTGNAGDVTVSARESIEVAGGTLISFTTSFGNAGDVTISTPQLRLKDGGSVSSAVLLSVFPTAKPFPGAGTGNSGRVVINSELVEVSGFDSLSFIPSTIGALSFGAGNAGNTLVNTSRLVVRDGGQVSSSTSARGDAGSLTINADMVSVSGTSAKTGVPSSISADASSLNEAVRRTLSLPPVLTGNTGELTVNTGSLSMTDGGTITVKHSGTGNAGRLTVNAESVQLNQDSRITASTASGQGGNIFLNVQDSLQLRDRSQVTAEAGGIGDGGNITINADLIAAFADSSIIANASQGDGGNVQISTQGLLLSQNSTISASSQLGLDGAVEVDNPSIGPESGLVKLPDTPANAAELIAAGCAAAENTFVVTGRGGLPENPAQPLRGQSVWLDWRLDLAAATENRSSLQDAEHPPALVEAQGWALNPQGNLELLSSVPTAALGTPHTAICRI